jgi:hypothetical protein
VDGGTYYVIASTGQSNLNGDSRLVDQQVIQLAESENEARAGVFIDIGAAPAAGSTGTLVARHVLDSGFATGVGVVAQLQSESKASASAGLKSDDGPDAKKSPWKQFNEAKDTNLFNALFDKLTKSYGDNASKSQSGAADSLSKKDEKGKASSVSIAGALAFSFVKQNVRTDVNSTAVLKSNEDLEVKATIAQKFNLAADSTTEPQEGGDGSGAQTNVSIAIAIAIIDNDATAVVHGGAQLDGLRATRVIADVSYPFLQRFDTFIPLSWGELADAIRTDGAEAVTKYLNLNLGAKDAFFNTWTTATAAGQANDGKSIGVAGSVSVLVFTNDAVALVEDGAKINQDAGWRDNGVNPHANQAVNVPTATRATTFLIPMVPMMPHGSPGSANRSSRSRPRITSS